MKQLCSTKLTRPDNQALWHAAKAQSKMVAVRFREGFTPEQLGPERYFACLARTALRKLNAIRQAQAPTAHNGKMGCPDG